MRDRESGRRKQNGGLPELGPILGVGLPFFARPALDGDSGEV